MSILSGLMSIPGTVLAGAKVACPICAKKLSGLRVRVCVPTLRRG